MIPSTASSYAISIHLIQTGNCTTLHRRSQPISPSPNSFRSKKRASLRGRSSPIMSPTHLYMSSRGPSSRSWPTGRVCRQRKAEATASCATCHFPSSTKFTTGSVSYTRNQRVPKFLLDSRPSRFLPSDCLVGLSGVFSHGLATIAVNIQSDLVHFVCFLPLINVTSF